ncbi:MAG: hypothetical protein SX243_22110 [Acidobacteriota bacterium]|nr:hypothetical protein [Acidobacteriota bacterium]
MNRPVVKMLMAGGLGVLLIPPAVFLAVALGEGMGLGGAGAALVAQYTASQLNLLVCGALGLVPVLLVLLILWVHRKVAPGSLARPALALGGLLPILLILVWANWDYWPRFLPSRTYPGFPHGLGLVIAPFFFAPIGGVVGMVVGWLVTRVQR